MRFPTVLIKCRSTLGNATTHFSGRVTAEGAVGTLTVVIDLEISKLLLQIAGVPEERVIETLTTNGSDQSLDKGM
jgi:hypothetical protein